MSVARGFGINGQKYYTNVTRPVDLNLTFTVSQANTAGLGVTAVKSNGYIENVFMHTTQTPGLGNGNILNPNPAVGYAMVQIRNNFNVFLGSYGNVTAPLATTGVTSLTTGNVYVINTLGTTTLAQWVTAGLNPGVTPAIGAAFVAKVTASIGGTGTVGTPGLSPIIAMSVVGVPNTTIANSNIAVNAGALVMVQFLAATSTSVTTPIATNPADNSVVNMMLRFDNSSVTVDGL